MASFDMRFERTIVAKQGETITLDAPLVESLNASYGRSKVVRVQDTRISDVGVERLTIRSDYDPEEKISGYIHDDFFVGDVYTDEDHAWIAVQASDPWTGTSAWQRQ